jgi:hypothetical protein
LEVSQRDREFASPFLAVSPPRPHAKKCSGSQPKFNLLRKKSKKVVAFIEFFVVCNYILDTNINH